MKIKEIINEAYTHNSIRKQLESKGYKFLGSGVDQQAYLEPGTGMILKIFGTAEGSKVNAAGEFELTKAQKTFKAFADYCNAHPNNPFLPQFSDWAQFVWEGKPYLQIRMERLFEIPDQEWADRLEYLADAASDAAGASAPPGFTSKKLEQWIRVRLEADLDSYNELFTHLGEDGIRQLWFTVIDLHSTARKIGLAGLDLHSGNFMVGSDGHIVISDPFFVGWDS